MGSDFVVTLGKDARPTLDLLESGVFGFVLFAASAFVKTLFPIVTPGRLNIASNYLDKATKMAHHGCIKAQFIGPCMGLKWPTMTRIKPQTTKLYIPNTAQ